MSRHYATGEQYERWHVAECCRCGRRRNKAGSWPDGHVCRTCADRAPLAMDRPESGLNWLWARKGQASAPEADHRPQPPCLRERGMGRDRARGPPLSMASSRFSAGR